ncbi:WYL domain-containing protein [Malikia sp.]|uniref:helix-turn-helix transcriptional regulator n=1 Tax=Malikia sp. TaxID=2070706 RepID=UPI00261A8D76|nr:WYL domain-containing protein [Malikia sp.]MDD2728415.1 WYL domain-containing protein [Malikia sp.]
MHPTSHDTLVVRLSRMLLKLNQGERLDPQALADEFGVNLRTIQRDLNERLSYLPLQKSDGRYALDPAVLGQISGKDIERFASLAGVQGLFPRLSSDFLRDIFDSRIQSSLLVKGHHYEDLSGRESDFQQLKQAIRDRHRVGFDYRKPEGLKPYAGVQPYKLLNHKGIWYLAAQDGDKLKSFSFSKIERLRVSDTVFEPDPTIEPRLQQEDGIWLGQEKKEVVLKVAKAVAGYFKRRQLIANQVIEKDLEDGGLIVSAKVAHPNQILPIVRYWIPHVRIISPEGLQAEMEQEVSDYLKH